MKVLGITIDKDFNTHCVLTNPDKKTFVSVNTGGTKYHRCSLDLFSRDGEEFLVFIHEDHFEQMDKVEYVLEHFRTCSAYEITFNSKQKQLARFGL